MNTKLSPDMAKILLLLLLISSCIPIAMGQEAKDAGKPAATAKETGKPAKAVPPIYLAAKQGNLSAVRSLIAEGKDVNAVNASGRSALMSAVFFRNHGIVRELLIEGANVNSVDAQGRTALMMAVIMQDLVLIDLLLASGADVAVEDKTKNTATTLAERTKNKKLLKLLEDSSG